MSAILNNVSGTYTVSYPSADLNTVVEGYTPEQIRAELAGTYKELEKATVNVTVNGSEKVVTFALPSGQKN